MFTCDSAENSGEALAEKNRICVQNVIVFFSNVIVVIVKPIFRTQIVSSFCIIHLKR